MPTPVLVRLAADEIRMAAQYGLARTIFAIFRCKKNPRFHPDDPTRWANDILGALAECAVAKYLGLYWFGTVGQTKADDAGPYQVRTVGTLRNVLHPQLVIRPHDPDNRVFILVTFRVNETPAGQPNDPRFILHGWIWGEDGKRQPLRDPGKIGCPAHFIDEHLLQDMADLPTIAEARGRDVVPF